jgi:hypothetical protein
MMGCEPPGRAVLAVTWRTRAALIEGPAWGSGEAGQRAEGGGDGMDGDFLAAPATAGAPSREIADVIWCSCAFAPARPEAWLSEMLDRHPGCGVAAVRLGQHACAVCTRAGYLLTFTLPAHRGPEACGPLLPAAFAYAWLSAGWPLPMLARTRLQVLGDVSALASGVIGEELTRLSFTLCYQRGAHRLGAGPAELAPDLIGFGCARLIKDD